MAAGKNLTKVMAILVLSLLGNIEARALSLDLDHCPQPDPEGKAYIAVGTAVLRLPVRTLLVVDNPPSGIVFPRPPHPEEPQGCKGNPLPQLTLIQAFQFEAWHAQTKRRSPLKQLRLIGDLPSYVGLHLDEAHVESCRVLRERVRLGNGLEGCLPVRKASDRHVPGSGSNQAPRTVYALPFGQLFTASCIPSAGGIRVACTVSYRVATNLAVTYKFDTTDLPLEQVIEFDRQLSSQIKSAIVPDYPWSQRIEQ